MWLHRQIEYILLNSWISSFDWKRRVKATSSTLILIHMDEMAIYYFLVLPPFSISMPCVDISVSAFEHIQKLWIFGRIYGINCHYVRSVWWGGKARSRNPLILFILSMKYKRSKTKAEWMGKHNTLNDVMEWNVWIVSRGVGGGTNGYRRNGF